MPTTCFDGCGLLTRLGVAGLETNTRPRRVQVRPGEWFVRPDQPGWRVESLQGFIDHTVIATLSSLALISSGFSQDSKLNPKCRPVILASFGIKYFVM